jgi:hypothetical protein
MLLLLLAEHISTKCTIAAFQLGNRNIAVCMYIFHVYIEKPFVKELLLGHLPLEVLLAVRCI